MEIPVFAQSKSSAIPAPLARGGDGCRSVACNGGMSLIEGGADEKKIASSHFAVLVLSISRRYFPSVRRERGIGDPSGVVS